MKLKVTNKGVMIPKELLGESEEIEIIQQDDKLIIIKKKPSIWDLGKNPVECNITKEILPDIETNQQLSSLLLLPELEDNEELFIRD
jgi:virulence-associated protein VagC